MFPQALMKLEARSFLDKENPYLKFTFCLLKTLCQLDTKISIAMYSGLEFHLILPNLKTNDTTFDTYSETQRSKFLCPIEHQAR